MILARKINKIPELYFPEKNNKIPEFYIFFQKNARILHNNYPKNIFPEF